MANIPDEFLAAARARVAALRRTLAAASGEATWAGEYAGLLVLRALAAALARHAGRAAALRVLDPACGCGALLLGLAALLGDLAARAARALERPPPPPAALLGALYGADLQARAVQVAAFRLWLQVGAEPAADHLRAADS